MEKIKLIIIVTSIDEQIIRYIGLGYLGRHIAELLKMEYKDLRALRKLLYLKINCRDIRQVTIYALKYKHVTQKETEEFLDDKNLNKRIK